MRQPPLSPVLSEEEFRLLRELLHARSGIWFRDDHGYLLARKLAPRLQVHGLTSYKDYHRFVRFDPRGGGELDEAVDAVTTNETYLYREPYQLRAFQREILPALAAARARDRHLTVLSAGCSTGEEAYTIAILLKTSGLFEGWKLEVVGVDVSRRCLAVAESGSYGERSFRGGDSEWLRPWFRLRGGRWVVSDAIRELVRFSQGNLVGDRGLEEAGRVDAVFCRNVMIYFDAPARKRALARIHHALRPGGWLLLGHSESLVTLSADFELVHLTDDLVYRKPMSRESAP
jgi:chemotaxis protein methyltransferase CheR